MSGSGGKRDGAGRKPSEQTIRVSVPVGVLDKVNSLIAAYKAGDLNIEQKQEQQDKFFTGAISEENEPELNEDVKNARKELGFLPSRLKKIVIKRHGSLYQAALDGIRWDSKNKRFSVPYSLWDDPVYYDFVHVGMARRFIANCSDD